MVRERITQNSLETPIDRGKMPYFLYLLCFGMISRFIQTNAPCFLTCTFTPKQRPCADTLQDRKK